MKVTPSGAQTERRGGAGPVGGLLGGKDLTGRLVSRAGQTLGSDLPFLSAATAAGSFLPSSRCREGYLSGCGELVCGAVRSLRSRTSAHSLFQASRSSGGNSS